MKYLLIEMLNLYLTECGRTDVINKELDIHSTISLEFNNVFPINIDLSDNDIILWTNFGQYSEIDITHLSFDLFQFTMTNSSAWYPRGQPTLYIDNDQLILSAVLLEQTLHDYTVFKQSMEYFYERICILHDIITK